MNKKLFGLMILIGLTLGLLTVFIVSANALEFSIQIGPPPPPPPPPPSLRPGVPPVAVYDEFYSDVILNLGSVYFGLDYPVVYGYYHDYGLTPDEVVYVLYLSHYCHRPPIFVIDVYKRYHRRGWSIMARELRLPPGVPNWMRDRNAPSVAVLHATSAYYGVPYIRIQEIHQKGYKPAEIITSVNISSRSGRPVGDILGERSRGKKWEDIARENRTSFDNIKSPRERGKSVKFGAPLTEQGTPPRGFEKNNKEFKGEGNAFGRNKLPGQEAGQAQGQGLPKQGNAFGRNKLPGQETGPGQREGLPGQSNAFGRNKLPGQEAGQAQGQGLPGQQLGQGRGLKGQQNTLGEETSRIKRPRVR